MTTASSLTTTAQEVHMEFSPLDFGSTEVQNASMTIGLQASPTKKP
jgi:hypothetical protein